jgi:CspA family cold shock protein
MPSLVLTLQCENYFRKIVEFREIFKFTNITTTKNMNGSIKKKTDKGFGFITSPELEKDLFFHSNSLVDVTFDELQEGDNVSFDSEESPKGLNAVNVKRA